MKRVKVLARGMLKNFLRCKVAEDKLVLIIMHQKVSTDTTASVIPVMEDICQDTSEKFLFRAVKKSNLFIVIENIFQAKVSCKYTNMENIFRFWSSIRSKKQDAPGFAGVLNKITFFSKTLHPDYFSTRNNTSKVLYMPMTMWTFHVTS